MSSSPTAVKMRDALTALHALLLTEMKPAKPDGYLAMADECIIGLHAQDASFQPSGIYILPARDHVQEPETEAWQHWFHARLIIQKTSFEVDRGQADPPTFHLLDLTAGVLDLLQANRTLLAGGVESHLFVDDSPDAVTFQTIVLDGGLAYRSEVNVKIFLES